jgi:two-component system OmpR family response regulator
VLVVDDEQMLTDLLSMALRMEGWEVRTAGSGFDALAQAREFDPDAMVLDIMMPDLDGMAVLQRLRHAGNDVPVLFLTAKDAVATASRASPPAATTTSPSRSASRRSSRVCAV